MLKSSRLGDRFKKEILVNNLNIQTQDIENSVYTHSTKNIEDIISDLKDLLFNKIASIPVWTEYTDLKQKEMISSFIDVRLNFEKITLSDSEKNNLVSEMYALLSGLGPLDFLLSKENVSAVFVNGTRGVHIEIGNKILNTEILLSDAQLNIIINNIFKLCNENFTSSKKIFNFKTDKYLISLVFPPVCESGINLTIRKILTPDIKVLFEKNLTTKEIFDFIISMLNDGKNLIISGDINSGKSFFLDVLINSVNAPARSILLENYKQLSTENDNLIKFTMPENSFDKNALFNNLLKISSDYIFADLNYPLSDFSERKGFIFTLRAPTVDSAITKLTSAFMAEYSLPEKYAKAKVLSDYDYIIQINKMNDGSSKITSIVELNPGRTAALSLKVIAKLVDGQYITEIPQPLTSIKAESSIAKNGSMHSRFLNSD